MMRLKKMASKICWILLFCLIPQTFLFAGGLIHRGEIFKAPETVRYFTLPEAKQLLKEREEARRLKEKFALVKDREALYEKEIELLRQVDERRNKAIEIYGRSIEALESSLKEARYACQVYKQMIQMQHESMKTYAASAHKQRRWSRTQRNLMFLAGFLTPLAGAWAVGRVVGAGNILKF